jgi:hypothetical protein
MIGDSGPGQPEGACPGDQKFLSITEAEAAADSSGATSL